VEELRSRGGDVEKFAKRLSFFFYVHMDFFDEIAKFRAGRRLWARFMKERYGVKDRSTALPLWRGVWRLLSGRTSALQQCVRVAVETMAAVFGGAQSIFTCALDEAFQIPTEFSAELAVRTQQILAFESGIGRTVDPLGGSYFLEQHTDRMEEMITKVMSEIDAYGGVIPAIEDGWMQLRLASAAGAQARHRRRQERDRGPEFLQKRERGVACASCSRSIRRSRNGRWRSSSASSTRVNSRRWTPHWPSCQPRPPTTARTSCPTCRLLPCLRTWAKW